MGQSDPVLMIDNLTKRYGEFTALDSLSISLDRGNILGFIGPNGAGKTTTIKILVGLARPTSGSAHIAGVDCTRYARKIKRLVGYLPDKFGSYDNMRVREYLDFFGAAFGIPRKKRMTRIDEVMETTHSTYMKDRFVESLSHGMKQRVGIARILLHDPQILILDEPANGLDPQARIEMRDVLLKLADEGKTLIVTSHILAELSRICNQVAIITHGKLRAFGTLDEIMRQVSQQRIIEVQLVSPKQVKQTVELVRSQLGPDSEVNGSDTESAVRFSTSKREDELGALLATLIQSGINVTQFRELQIDLEDAFLSVIQTDSDSDDSSQATSKAGSLTTSHSVSEGRQMHNPILERELIGLLRTRKAIAILIGMAVACSVLVLVEWPTDARVDLSESHSRQVFQVFGYGLLTALLMMVPIFPASTIVREKNKGTLALLLNSTMSPWSIYLGKLLGVLGFALLILNMSLPSAAACYAMGGIALVDVSMLYAVLALAVMQFTTLGLFVSSLAKTTDSAMRMTYGAVLLISVVTLGPHLFLQGQPGWTPLLAEWLRSVSPVSAVMEILGDGDLAGQGLVAASRVAQRYLVLAIAISLLLILLTVARLNYSIFDRSRAQGVITDDRGTGQRWFRRLFFLIDPQRRTSGIGPFINPVMVKEFRCRRFGRSHSLMRLVAGCALISLVLTYATTSGTMDWGVSTIGGIMVIMQVTLIVLVTPSLASGLISSERESEGWEILQMTPLSVGVIIRGKLLSVVWTLALILCATLPGYLVMIYIEPTLTHQVERVLFCLLLTAVLATTLSAAVSSLFRRTAQSTATTYTLLIGSCAGTMLFWLGRDSRFGHSTVEAALTINPMATALNVIEFRGFIEYQLVPANWWAMGAAILACLIVLSVQTWRLTRPQ